MKYNFDTMWTNGRMAAHLGIDPKTLRKWAEASLVPSYVNPDNRYRYYRKSEVLAALETGKTDFERIIDAIEGKE